MLGTWHQLHFNKWLGYSIADVLSVVKQVQPDVVFIESREEYFSEYGVVDGPVDMSVVYSYCIENELPTEMIDWWIVDNDFQSNSTNGRRDNMIFKNISNKLDTISPDAKILIVCGATHFYEQSKRFEDNGFEKQRIKNKTSYFKYEKETFKYPVGLQNVWEQRSYFYAYTFPEIIAKDKTLSEEIKQQFTGGNKDGFYKRQLQYNELFSNNILFE